MDNFIRNFGIITSISWHTNKWMEDPDPEDINESKFGNVHKFDKMVESLNFGHHKYPAESDGYYIGHSPFLWDRVDQRTSKNVKIVFFKSKNYRDDNTYIVGCYGFPIIGIINRDVELHPMYEVYDGGDIRSKPEDIIIFNNFLKINNNICDELDYLPKGKKLGQRNYNYIHSYNVFNVLKDLEQLNPQQSEITRLKQKLEKLHKILLI